MQRRLMLPTHARARVSLRVLHSQVRDLLVAASKRVHGSVACALRNSSTRCQAIRSHTSATPG